MDADASEMLATNCRATLSSKWPWPTLGCWGAPDPRFHFHRRRRHHHRCGIPGSRLMEQLPPPVAPTPSPWMAAKDVRSTATPAPVVPSGWTGKNTIAPTPTSQPTQVEPSNSTSSSSASFRNPFGHEYGYGHDRPNSAISTPCITFHDPDPPPV